MWFSCNQLSHCGGIHTKTDLSNVVSCHLQGKYGKQLFKSCPFPWLSHCCTGDVVTRSRCGEAVAAALPTAPEAFCWWCWCREGAWSTYPSSELGRLCGGEMMGKMGTLLADSETFLVNTQGCDWVCDPPQWLPGVWWCTYCGWLPWGGAWGSGKNQGFMTVRATCCQAGETVVVQWLNPLGWPFPFLCVLDCRRHTCDGRSWEESKRAYVSPMRECKGTRQVCLAGTGRTSWAAAVVCQPV